MKQIYTLIVISAILCAAHLSHAQELVFAWSLDGYMETELEINPSRDFNNDGINDIKIKRRVDENTVGFRILSGDDKEILGTYPVELDELTMDSYQKITVTFMSILTSNENILVVHSKGPIKTGVDKSTPWPVITDSVVTFPESYEYIGTLDHNGDGQEDMVFINTEDNKIEIWVIEE